MIQIWDIDFIFLLDSRGLDCHENATHFLAMTKLWQFALIWIRFCES
ncbi:hypothetical protein [Helicobacter sp. 23-1045]